LIEMLIGFWNNLWNVGTMGPSQIPTFWLWLRPLSQKQKSEFVTVKHFENIFWLSSDCTPLGNAIFSRISNPLLISVWILLNCNEIQILFSSYLTNTSCIKFNQWIHCFHSQSEVKEFEVNKD
jgi:hypothetical protein